MADDDETPRCQVTYLDVPEPEETNWIKRAGKCKVVYPNGCTFEGTYDDERVKQGPGVYIWNAPTSEEDETLTEKARFDGIYKDGLKNGLGTMIYPNGDKYEGQWVDDKMHGEGSYEYKSTGDIYSGTWDNNKKAGKGTYEFKSDNSILCGTWVDGQITNGEWRLKGCAVYEGEFKGGRPYGAGSFNFESKLKQKGSFEEIKGEGDEEPAEDEGPKVPNVFWKGESIISF